MRLNIKAVGWLVVANIIISTGCSVFGVRKEETPNYEVVTTDGDKEIREYESYIVAKTTVKGPYKEAQNEGFRILAGYIFGDNVAETEIAMTAPVTQKPESQKIAMTAPVTQTETDDGWTMTFMMPSRYTMETLPKPNDERVSFEMVPARTVAAIRYSWGRGDERNQKKGEELKSWIASLDGFTVAATPTYAGYDPPWTLPFLRRHEMHIDVARRE